MDYEKPLPVTLVDGEPQGAEVRIYRRGANPMQSGPAHAGEWVLEFEPITPPEVDPLMGWVSSDDVLQQVRLTFNSLDEALAYCSREKLVPVVQTPAPRRKKPKSYADNFVPFADGGPRPIYQH
ncbi:MAG: ETC complex I subunit [Solirubrobacterales bacterium]